MLYGDRVLNEPVLILKIAGPVSAFLIILFVVSSAAREAASILSQRRRCSDSQHNSQEQRDFASACFLDLWTGCGPRECHCGAAGANADTAGLRCSQEGQDHIAVRSTIEMKSAVAMCIQSTCLPVDSTQGCMSPGLAFRPHRA